MKSAHLNYYEFGNRCAMEHYGKKKILYVHTIKALKLKNQGKEQPTTMTLKQKPVATQKTESTCIFFNLD